MFDTVLESATSLRNQTHHKVDVTLKGTGKTQHDYNLRHLKSNGIKVVDKVLQMNSKRNDRKGGKFTFK